MRWLALAIIVLLTTGAAPVAPVRVEGQVLVISGSLNKAAYSAAKVELDANPNIRVVSLSSSGGDAEAAMDLAELLRTRNLSVRIETVCASSCALYVAPAARELSLGDDALVAFHQMPSPLFRYITSEVVKQDSALTETQRSQRLIALGTMLDRVMARQNRFYRAIGVDPTRIYPTTDIMVDIRDAIKARALPIDFAKVVIVPDADYLTRCMGYPAGPWRRYVSADSVRYARYLGKHVTFIIDGRLYYEGGRLNEKSYGCRGVSVSGPAG